MSEFLRFPHTPHLAWFGDGSPRDDKVLSSAEAHSILAGEVIVEEKLDGANLGFSIGSAGRLRVQNRGQYLTTPYSGQFSRLTSWFGMHEQALTEALGSNLILFGEWCAARHSLNYENLPDWFLAFDVYDTRTGKFWNTSRRDQLAAEASIALTPSIFKGKTSLGVLESLILQGRSRFRNGSLEGIVVRKEYGDWLVARVKLVHPEFTQNITEHWSRRGIKWNRMVNCGAPHKEATPHY